MTALRLRPLIAFAAATLVIGALASEARGAVPDRHVPTRATKIVRGIGSSWSPATVRISPGDRIRWKGVSGTHTVTAYGTGWRFDRSLAQGAIVGRTFRRAGVFKFRCVIHSFLADGRCSGMCGKVVVRA